MQWVFSDLWLKHGKGFKIIFKSWSSWINARLPYVTSSPQEVPVSQFGVAGDLYIQLDDNIVFYKEITTATCKGKWRLASDTYTIHHPSEFTHHLIVTADHYLQWSQNRLKAFSFKHAMSVVTTVILANHLTVPRDTPSNLSELIFIESLCNFVILLLSLHLPCT